VNGINNLYDVLVSEMQWFLSLRDARMPLDLLLAKRISALAQFALFLSRPASRQQLLAAIPFHATKVQFDQDFKNPTKRHYLTFAAHKNAVAYGAIFWPVAEYIVPLLHYYTTIVRDFLLTDASLWVGGEAAQQFLFPPASVSAALLVDFGKTSFLPDLSLAQIRSMFCEHIQSIAVQPDHSWSTRAGLIQGTAAHGTHT